MNCCTIDWFSAWPADALTSVAARFLDDLDVDDDVKKSLVLITTQFHVGVQEMAVDFLAQLRRHYYVTPTSFLELINTYKSLLQMKQVGELRRRRPCHADQHPISLSLSCFSFFFFLFQKSIMELQRRYEVGLEKLRDSEESVASMQDELEDMKPKLVESSAEVEELMKVIDGESVEANKVGSPSAFISHQRLCLSSPTRCLFPFLLLLLQVREVVKKEEAIAQGKADQAKAIKDDTEGQLAEAMPLLEGALKALDTLSKNDITEVKGMKSPPAGVKLVMEAVCIMKGLKPARIKDPSGSGKMIEDYWETAKKMITDTGTEEEAGGKRGGVSSAAFQRPFSCCMRLPPLPFFFFAEFLKSLQEYDKDNIPPQTITKIRIYIANPEFVPDKIKQASRAAFGLCSWVRAMEAYDRVAKVVAPKRAALAKANEEFEEVMVGLREKQAELKKVEDR